MRVWHQALFLILAVLPSIFSRHLGSSRAKKLMRRHKDGDADVSRSWSRTSLKLHDSLPPTVTVLEGTSHVLECQAAGSPRPRIYWFRDNKLVSKIDEPDPELDSVDLSRLGVRSVESKLFLDCVGQEEDGVRYTCVAENVGHREMSTTELRVEASSQDSCDDQQDIGRAPRVVYRTKSVLENQGQDALLTCRADGDPRPSVSWFNNIGIEIQHPESSKYKVLPNGDLVVRRIKWKDMGNYLCQATNAHGSVRSEVFLYPVQPEQR